jgi:hypothetical protein
VDSIIFWKKANGPRKLNIILTQLRNSYSFLNYDRSKVDIVNDASCSCGAPRENVYHYFFTCPNYAEIRLTMTNNLNWIQTIDLNLLTCESGVWMAFLNLVNVSRIQSDWSSRFQSLTVDGITDSVVIESLRKGIIQSEPFLKG